MMARPLPGSLRVAESLDWRQRLRPGKTGSATFAGNATEGSATNRLLSCLPPFKKT